MADLAQLQTWLTEAESARHALAMGQAVVEVWRDGRRLTFAKASIGNLDDYITGLTDRIAVLTDAEYGTTNSRRRAIGITYSN